MKKESGFCLVELVWATTCGVLLLIVFLMVLLHLAKFQKEVRESVEIWQNACFSRQVICSRTRFALEEPVITHKGDGLHTGELTKFHFRYVQKQLYRMLSNGGLQPYTGTALGRGGSRVYVERIQEEPIFQKNEIGLISLKWKMKNVKNQSRDVDMKIFPYLTYFQHYLSGGDL